MASTNTLNSTLRLDGSGLMRAVFAGSRVSEKFSIGSGDWDALLAAFATGDSDVPSSAGVGYANQWYVAERSILTTANDDLDLAGGLTNAMGQVVTFTKIKFLLIAIDSPDGVKKLRFGPQNVANAWAAGFGALGATLYKDVFDWEVLVNNKWAGVAVTAGSADVLRINNPGAGTVTYRLLVIGVQ